MFAGHAREVEYMAGGDGIEGQTLAQVVGMIESSIFHSGATFQCPEILFNAPSPFVPLHRGARGSGTQAALGAEQ